MKNFVKTVFSASVIAFVLFLLAGNMPLVIGAVMSSSNYAIQSDSVNLGGGQSSSANYKVEDTAGEVATGDSESTNYKIKAGYQQMNVVYLAMTAITDVVLAPSLGGITGGTSDNSGADPSTGTTVTTDGAAGYELYFKASSSPAMQGNTQGDSILDYTPAAAGIPDYAYSVPTGEEFGYTVSASTTADLAQKFLDNGTDTCNTGSADTSGSASCWYGLSTTATSTIVRNTETSASGSTSSVVFKLTINSGTGFVTEDTYNATATLTATIN